MNICVVGVGAVGSYLTELLVRLGCEKLTLLDGDGVSIGNFSRHTLTMESLVQYKAESVAERLNAIFPLVRTRAINTPLKKMVEGSPDFLDQFQIIIDCTAEDDVLNTLSFNCRLENQIVFSVSLGQEAQSLVAFFNRYPHENLLAKFQAKSTAWMQKQRQTFPNPNFPLEGIGCWHPVFPARIDDIHGLVACTVRRMESFLLDNVASEMVIIERSTTGAISIESET